MGKNQRARRMKSNNTLALPDHNSPYSEDNPLTPNCWQPKANRSKKYEIRTRGKQSPFAWWSSLRLLRIVCSLFRLMFWNMYHWQLPFCPSLHAFGLHSFLMPARCLHAGWFMPTRLEIDRLTLMDLAWCTKCIYPQLLPSISCFFWLFYTLLPLPRPSRTILSSSLQN